VIRYCEDQMEHLDFDLLLARKQALKSTLNWFPEWPANKNLKSLTG